MVLEPCERLAGPGAVQQDVADQAALSGDRVQRQQPDARDLGPAPVAVEPAEQLVAAADGEKRRPGGGRFGERAGLAGEIGRDERLLAILPAADVEEVDGRRHRLAEPDRLQLEIDPAGPRPGLEHGDVPAIGVDVEVLRVEVADAELHAAAARSRGRARGAAISPRRPSIAV